MHADHHDKPYYHVCVDPPDLVAGWTLAAACVFGLVLPLPLALTVLACYMTMGLVYEWVHFFVHTRWVGGFVGDFVKNSKDFVKKSSRGNQTKGEQSKKREGGTPW